MTPPIEYFRRCDAGTPGAQRVGFEWFAWVDQDSLSRALNDGMFELVDKTLAEQLEDAEAVLSGSKEKIQELEKRVEELEKKLEEERA